MRLRRVSATAVGRWVTLVAAATGPTLLAVEVGPRWVGWLVFVVGGLSSAWLWGAGALLKRRGMQWAMALGSVIVVLILANMLATRRSFRMDLTRERRHTLSQQTLQVLHQFQTPVKVIAFPEGGSSRKLEDLLKEYSHACDHLTYRMVDPDREPATAREYGITSYGAVVVEAVGSKEQIEEATESTLTNALARLLTRERRVVTFLTGHGEHDPDDSERSGASLAREALESRNFDVTSAVMAHSDSVLAGVDVVVIAGPQTEPLPHEVQTLRSHLANGGGVLVLTDPPPSASWNRLLKEYSVRRESSFVLDDNPLGTLFGTDRSVPLVSNYGSHAITEGFNLATFFPLASPLALLSDTTGVVELALAGDLSSAVGPDSIARRPDEGEALVLACAVEISPADTASERGRLVVVGDSDFATNTFVGLSGNRDFFLNCVQWLATQEELIAVGPRASEGEPLVLTAGAASSIFLVAVILLPGAALAGAVIVWWRRR